MKPKRPIEELKCRDRAGADACVRENMGLIGNVLNTFFPWAYEQIQRAREDFVAVGMWSVVKAHRDHDPAIAKFSTLATKYIVNDVNKKLAERKARNNRMISNAEDGQIVVKDHREQTPLETACFNEAMTEVRRQRLIRKSLRMIERRERMRKKQLTQMTIPVEFGIFDIELNESAVESPIPSGEENGNGISIATETTALHQSCRHFDEGIERGMPAIERI